MHTTLRAAAFVAAAGAGWTVRAVNRQQRRAAARDNHRQAKMLVRAAGNELEGGELAELMRLTALWDCLPDVPRCPGPLLLHRTGASECHAPGCAGVEVVFHGHDALCPCDFTDRPGRLEVLASTCSACSHLS